MCFHPRHPSPSSLKTHLCLFPTDLCPPFFFFHPPSPICAAHTSLGVWPFASSCPLPIAPLLGIAMDSHLRSPRWDLVQLELVQSLCMLSWSLWAHTGSCPVQKTPSAYSHLSSATSSFYGLLFCPDLQVWRGAARIEKTHLGMSTPQLFSALQPVVGLWVNHHLLQIEASVKRAERMNTGMTTSH